MARAGACAITRKLKLHGSGSLKLQFLGNKPKPSSAKFRQQQAGALKPGSASWQAQAGRLKLPDT